MAELHVAIAGRRIGTLERAADGRLRFAYEESWLDRRGATPLSLSMPLRPGWFDHDVVHPYLWGLLPDNEDVIDRWAKQYQCSPTNVFALLANVGGDVAGAAQYLEPDTEAEEGVEGSYQWLDDAAVAALLREVQEDSAAWHPSHDQGRWSLAGAQSKIALAFDDERGWAIPHGAAPTTHILKPAITRLADHDLNELLCVRAARRLGLSTEDASLGHFDDQRALVVRRYDRARIGEVMVRLHQEDFCQALGVHPNNKYQADGGPSVEDMVGLLRDNSTAPGVDVGRLVDAVAYNWLTLGSDAHAKNYALVLAGRTVRLAPLYDLGSLAPYAKYAPKVKLAQKVGGEYRAGAIADRHWRRLAASARLDPDELIARIGELADMLPDAFRDVLVDLELDTDEHDAGAKIIESIVKWTATCRQAIERPVATEPSSPAPAPAPARRPQGRKPSGTPQGGRFTSARPDEADGHVDDETGARRP